MQGAGADRVDFFLSRRGTVAAVAQEVADVLTAADYKVIVQDYDIPLGASFVEAMHEAVKNSRDLIILFTKDYEASPYTRKEFTSFEAERLRDERERHIVVLRCDDAPLRGLLADVVYQNLVGVAEPEERKRRILAAAERRSSAERPQRRRGRTFVGVPPRMASFTGRADELDRLDAILTQKRPAAVTQVGRVALQGMGGVGKTTLAVEYSYRFRNLYDGVWWCPAETRAGLMTSLAALAKELEVASPEKADIEMIAKAALRWLAEQGDIWLLVYDNVTSPSDLADLLPAAGARTLITSRFSDWSDWADEVSLDVLPIAEAMKFLMDRARRSDQVGARTLAEALGRLPLALDHAAATCKRMQMSFADYAEKASGLIANAPRGAPYPRSVAATFDLAIDDAVAQCPAAEALMAFLAHCAPEPIPLTLVEGAIDDESERMTALAGLAELSLIKHDPFGDGSPAVTVHRLVQAVARSRSEAKGTAHDAVTRLIAKLANILLKALGFYHSEELAYVRTVRGLLAVERDWKIGDPNWAQLLYSSFDYLQKSFQEMVRKPFGADALPLAQDALAAYEALGEDKWRSYYFAQAVALALEKLGRNDEARRIRSRFGLHPPVEPVVNVPREGNALWFNYESTPGWTEIYFYCKRCDFREMKEPRTR